MLGHRLEDVAVPHGGLPHVDARVPQGQLEAEVAHHGGHERVLDEPARVLERQGEDRHDLVPVDLAAGGVHGEAAVGVAVVGDPEVGPELDDGPLEGLQVGRAAAVVDVQAVGLRADDVHLGARAAEGVRRDPAGGAVGAVQDHAHPLEPVRDGPHQVQDVAVLGVREQVDAPDPGAGGAPEVAGLEDLLDLVLHPVRELPPAVGQELDPVVGGRVVRGGDHHAEVGVEVRHQVGQRGGRQDPGVVDVHARAGETRGHGGAEELPAGPPVPGDDRRGAPPLACVAVAEHDRGRLGQVQGHVGCEEVVREPAHAVRSE